MKCSDCKRFKTTECYVNRSAEDFDDAEHFACFIWKESPGTVSDLWAKSTEPTEAKAQAARILACPECSAQNRVPDPPAPRGAYRCGKCHAVLDVEPGVSAPETGRPQDTRGEDGNWTTVRRRVGLRTEPPRLLAIGGGRTGRLEHAGRSLRFVSKKMQIEMSRVRSVSLVTPRFNVAQLALFGLLQWVGVTIIVFVATVPFGANPLGSPVLGFIGAALSMVLTRLVFWKWVRIEYVGSGGRIAEVYLQALPIDGGVGRLHRDLARLGFFNINVVYLA